ncbi:MAG: redoxin family protein [Patescibacteria group bacterium]
MKIKQLLLPIVLLGIVVLIYWISGQKAGHGSSNAPVVAVTPRISVAQKASKYPVAKEITTPDGFINTGGQPIKIGDYIGKKVILLDIWTYSCINCQRTIPYLNAWYDKYKDKGLVVIGLHTPEFGFEKILDNVQKATEKFGISYPVVLDNDFSTWNAYQNSYWPRKYLIDIDGYVVYDHIGEGGDEDTEAEIQKLLQERADVLQTGDVIPTGFVAPGKVSVEAGSPETYFGSLRNIYLGNGEKGAAGIQTFAFPKIQTVNKLYLDGQWSMEPEYAESVSAGARVSYDYISKDVYIVASSKEGVTIEVQRDGMPLGAEAGKDVVVKDGASTIFIHDARLYHVIHENAPGEHTLLIKVRGAGLEAFTFTFG